MGFRGGTRMEMACGGRALSLLNENFRQNRQVSQAFSVQLHETGDAARRMNGLLEEEKRRYALLQQRLFRQIAGNFVSSGDVLHFEPDLDPVMVRELADAIAEVCGGTAAVFSGSDAAGYNFCMITRSGDLRQLCREMTGALAGRGGGKPICQQGKVAAAESRIRQFFAER